MLTVCSPNIPLNPVLHNIPIEIIYPCERPGIKFASLLLYVDWVNDTLHAVIDGSFLPHAEETKIV